MSYGYGRDRIHTVYDNMERKGMFAGNPANAGARDPKGRQLYKGPVQFPRMVYSPDGEFRITTPAEPVMTALGPKLVGEQRALVDKIAETAEEYEELRAAGWLDTPGEALAKNPGRLTAAERATAALPVAGVVASPAELLFAQKDREIADLRKQLAAAEEAAA